MTTKMTADELEDLRMRMREQMLADADAPAPPLVINVESVAAQLEHVEFADAPAPVAGEADGSPEPRLQPLLPMLVPAEPRVHVEAELATPRVHAEGEPAFAAANRTVLAKVVMLRPQPVQAKDGSAPLDPGPALPLPPLARELEVVEEQRSQRGEITGSSTHRR